jgi:hypothetical protein
VEDGFPVQQRGFENVLNKTTFLNKNLKIRMLQCNIMQFMFMFGRVFHRINFELPQKYTQYCIINVSGTCFYFPSVLLLPIDTK